MKDFTARAKVTGHEVRCMVLCGRKRCGPVIYFDLFAWPTTPFDQIRFLQPHWPLVEQDQPLSTFATRTRIIEEMAKEICKAIKEAKNV